MTAYKPLLSINQRHHLAATCFASGMTLGDVCAITGFGYAYLSALKADPLFQTELQRIAKRIEAMVVENAREVIHRESLNSVKTLIAIRDNTANSPSVRSKIAMDLLNRVKDTAAISRVSDLNNEKPPEITERQMDQLIAALNDDPLAKAAFQKAIAEGTAALLPSAVSEADWELEDV